MVLGGTDGDPGATYYVLTTTNISLPLPQWVRMETNQFDGTGDFIITNAMLPGVTERFYRLQIP